MKKDYSLYKSSLKSKNSKTNLHNPLKGRVIFFRPWKISMVSKLIFMGEKLNLLKIFLLSIYELLIGKSQIQIEIIAYYLNGKIISYAICQDINYHLPSENSTGIEVGTAYTKDNYRGLGLYPYIIHNVIKKNNQDIYMISKTSNISSTKGIEKAGLIFKKTISRRFTFFYPKYD